MSLAAWAARRDPKTAKAKRALDALPESSTKRGLAVPFPFADKSAYKTGRTNTEINDAIRNAPIKRIPLADLHSIQHSVKRDRVAHYLDSPDSVPTAKWNGPVDAPIVIQHDGKRYLHDGNHRLTAEFLKGATTGDVRFVNLDKDPADD